MPSQELLASVGLATFPERGSEHAWQASVGSSDQNPPSNNDGVIYALRRLLIGAIDPASVGSDRSHVVADNDVTVEYFVVLPGVPTAKGHAVALPVNVRILDGLTVQNGGAGDIYFDAHVDYIASSVGLLVKQGAASPNFIGYADRDVPTQGH